MTIEQFLNTIKANQKGIENLMNRVLPIKIGATAKAHFQENFVKGGFVNKGLQKWKPAKRLLLGKKGAKDNYKTLLSSRNNLFSATNYTPGKAQVTIHNKTPYAAVHNEGLKAGRGKGFTMPKRQFIGKSAELDKKAITIIENELRAILK